MSRQRAQRRVQRLASQQREERAARDAKAVRSQQRRAERRRARSSSPRGRAARVGLRRSRGQRLGIATVAVVGIGLIWLLADTPLAIALTVLLLLALPAFVVLALGRRY